jgi:molybdenum cofactor cytidylyltransferase
VTKSLPPPRHFAIVPAAGRSRRMGRPKLLLPLAGRTLMEVVVDAWQQAGVDRVVVVCRPDDQPLIDLCTAMEVVVVTPTPSPPEMKHSVAAALAAIADRFEPTPRDTWLLAPADLPRLSSTVIKRLLAAHDPGHPRILVPVHEGRRGHPVLLPWSLAREVPRLQEHQGVNQLLHSHAVREIACAAEAVADDMDTPADYQRYC